MKIASVFKSVTVAFSMYSRIPMPRFRWETEDMRYHLCFFPWVGGVIGILEYLWFLGVTRFEIGPTAATLIALSIPILVTGGFHDYVDEVAADFGFKPDHVLANSLIWAADGSVEGVDTINPLSKDGGKISRRNTWPRDFTAPRPSNIGRNLPRPLGER